MIWFIWCFWGREGIFFFFLPPPQTCLRVELQFWKWHPSHNAVNTFSLFCFGCEALSSFCVSPRIFGGRRIRRKKQQPQKHLNDAQSPHESPADTLSPRSSPTRKWIRRFNYLEIWPLFPFYFGIIPGKDNAHFKLCVCVCLISSWMEPFSERLPSVCQKPLPPVYFRSWLLVVLFLFFFFLYT